jgi:lysine 6-dehydrogenase
MKTFLVVGAGRQAVACAAFLLEQFSDTRVVFADRQEEQLRRATSAQRCADRVSSLTVRGGRMDAPELVGAVREADVVVSCLPFFLNEDLMRLTLKERVSYCDLGGNKGTVARQLSKASEAREAGITLVPDCGIAPGSMSVFAEYWQGEWAYESVRLLCGGLPQEPRNTLKYQLTFSPWGLLNEYLDECEVARDGQVVIVPGLGECERLNDLPLDGEFEAFATSGGASIAPSVYAPRSVDYEYKTIRYVGHRDIIASMNEMGFFDPKRTARRADGTPVGATMREISVSVLSDALPADRKDLIVARADVIGRTADGRRRGRIDLLDYADERFTAMERTTGFSAAIVAALQAGLYDAVIEPGAHVPFQVVPPKLLIEELRRAGVCGIEISETALE